MATPQLPRTAGSNHSKSRSDASASSLLDSLTPIQMSLLVADAAQGKLKSAKALRDALNLPVTAQKVQQMLRSDEFQRRVKNQMRAASAGRGDATDAAGDGDDAMGDNDMDSDYDDDDDDDDDDTGEEDTTAAGANVNRPQQIDERHAISQACASVTTPSGVTLTLAMNQQFKDRAAIKQAVRGFAEAQHKSVIIQRKTNGGNNFVYVCKSKTPCNFYVKVRRTLRHTTTTHVICGLHTEHGAECSGKPPNPRNRLRAQQRLGIRSGIEPAAVKSASVTLRDGSTLTLFERQEFDTRTELKDFVHDFALAQEKRARVDRTSSGGNNITFVCTSQTQCNFKVRALRSKKTHKHYVKTFDADHGQECTGKPSVTKRQVLKQLASMEGGNPATLALSGSDVQAIVKNLQGVNVTQRVASDARHELVGKVFKDVLAGIQKLESLLAQFQVLNPTSSTEIAFHQDGTFRRAFLKLPYASQVQSLSARVLGLNTSDMGFTSNFPGMLLELMVKDGNNDAYPVAVAVCDGKSAESYVWFLNCCVMGGVSFDVPMFCDRNSALLGAVESLPIPFTLIQCTRHLIANLEEKLEQQLSDDVKGQILRAQDADSESEYKSILQEISMTDAQVAGFLRSTDANTWTKHCYVQRFPLYGCQSGALVSPLAESVLGSVSKGDLSPFEFFQFYMDRCMRSVYEGKRNAKSWLNANRQLTAFATNALKKEESEALAYRVVPSDEEQGIAYIWDTRSPQPKKRRVNLSESSCTCSHLDQRMQPCKHLVAAVSFFNADGAASWDVSQLCDRIYTTQAYFDVYGQLSPIEIPVEEELVRNLNVKIAPSATTNRCSICHEVGHNRRRCKNAMAATVPTMSTADATATSSSAGSEQGTQDTFALI